MSIHTLPDDFIQAELVNRLADSGVDLELSKASCLQHQALLARMLSSGMKVEDAATWLARKLGVGLTDAERSIKTRIVAELHKDIACNAIGV